MAQGAERRGAGTPGHTDYVTVEPLLATLAGDRRASPAARHTLDLEYFRESSPSAARDATLWT